MNNMKTSLCAVSLGAALALSSAAALAAGGEQIHIPRQQWSFGGFSGHYDKAQLQRGFQVYKEVCSSCHGLKRIAFRNLVQKGGPGFPEASVKALAAKDYKVQDGPNDEGKMFMRPALLSDTIPTPFKNDNEARSANNGSLPPDLSVIAKARNTEHHAPWYTHVFLMLKDILTGYQEGGPDYLHALLTGYEEKVPAGKKNEDGTPFKLADGMNYNRNFPGNQIAMINPLSDGMIKYEDGTPAKVDNYARDVAAFLAWAADPTLDQRKRMGWQVMLYLLITTLLLYLAKRRLWAKLH